MKIRALILFFASVVSLFAQPSDYPGLKARAEGLYADGSFSQAHDIYQEAKKIALPRSEIRWVDFRLADTLWRSAAATTTADNTQFENAEKQLNALNRDIQRAEDHDEIWAEVEQSLGDFFWTRRNSQNWGAAWPHYQAALDWWAGAADVEQARQLYLKIVWSITQRPAWRGGEPYYYYYYGGQLPLEVLENAVKIAKNPNDLARAHYLLAMAFRNQGGDWDQRQRIPEEFEGAIKIGKTTDWYNDALYNYAEWMLSNGRVVPLKDGNWSQEPDYVKALELFRRLVREFKKGESRYFEQAQQQIKSITEPVINVSVGNVFLPDSEIQYNLNWRSVKRIDLALYAVDLTRDVRLSGDDEQRNDWLKSIPLASRKKIKSWTHDTKDKGDYKPGSETLRVEGKLPVGAYVLEAHSGTNSSRELVLVTDASVVLKTSGKQTLVYFCNALAGSPLSGAEVKLWERYYEGDHWHWHEGSKKTDTNGLTVFELIRSANSEQIFVGAKLNDQQAFSMGDAYYYGNTRREDNWRIYAFTDRPAYRPNETVQWKFIARRKTDGSAYVNPANQVIEYEIKDPRGAKVKEDKVTLNAFGSAWGSLDLKETMPLGVYNIQFWIQGRGRMIGEAALYRLEEYKLPEFKVSVQTPEENGRKKAFRLGEKVEVMVQANYYFGGAVANANVEVVVHQNPLYHFWHRPREFPWFYEDMSAESQRGRFYYGGEGPIIKRDTIKTDANGKASLTFETPRDQGQEFEYRIEARVTDASRREITGNGTVRVTRQRYYVNPEAAHNLYHPQDKVSVEFNVQDANDQPVQAEGTVKVTRDYWFEIWLDSNGHEVKGDELKNYRSRSLIFPPPPTKPGERGWQLKFRGYEHDDILTRTLKADTNGTAELAFTPDREGYYRIAWTSEDKGPTNALPAPPIHAETTVWVANSATTELGYRQGGVEIIVDKDTFRVGQKAPVMLSVPSNDRYVLFTVEGEDLYSYQLVHVTGTVKLLELPIEEKHVPNIFLNAALVSDRQMFTDQKQVIIPPTKNFVQVEVKPDKEQYQAREPGTFTITTHDDAGKPVSAEVAFGLVDESVYYIQSDFAGDPRQFYFGEKRGQQIRTGSTFDQKGYAKLVVGDNDQLLDIRDFEQQKRRRRLLESENAMDNYFIATNFIETLDAVNAPALSGASGMLADVETRGFGGGGGNRKLALSNGRDVYYARRSDLAAVSKTKDLSLSFDRLKEEPMAAAMPMASPPPGAPNEPAVQVRSDFRSTVVWQPDIITGADGKATVEVTYPDSLTSWKATARAVTEANQFGIATTNTHTKQPLIVRLEAPRFFVVGDTLTISAVVNNNTEKEMTVQPALEFGGVLSGVRLEPAAKLKVLANGEARTDWNIAITAAGEANLKVTARGGKYADAMEKPFTIYEHGIEKFIAKSGRTLGDDLTVKLNLPRERKAGSTVLDVQITPSLAVTMLDALPYLIDYPYGCTEQTMSRFLPAVITAKTLKDLGLKPDDVMNHLFGGIEPTSAAATHPKGKHDLHELDAITRQSLERLYDFQHGDGGWGWWKQGDSDHFMTAYVVWGLTMAHDAGISLKSGVLNRGVNYLDKTLVEEELNYDEQAWMLHALSTHHASLPQSKITASQTKAFDNLWNHREQLNAYTRALLALSAHHYGFNDKAKILIANLENGVKIDNHPDSSVLLSQPSTINNPPSTTPATAHWGEDGIYWRWSEGGVEATAFALRALLAIDPQNKLVEPVCNWLIKNRRGAQWSNTRDTAITVMTMNEYLRASGELSSELNYELLVNGQSVANKKVSGAEILSAPSRFAIESKLIRDGENDIRIVRHGGKGPIYFAANATFYSLEEPIISAGNEIFVRRQYYKLVGRPTLLKGYVYDREPLNDGGSVKSGERIETVITVEAKNNYEYLLFEDLKPAGFEAVEVRSGESLYAYELKSGSVDRKFGTNTAPVEPTQPNKALTPGGKRRVLSGRASGLIPRPKPVNDEDHTGRTRWVYQELRDRKVALFLDKLPQGVWEIKYDMRAEVPGQFHALPVIGHAMYVPEIRCNGDEVKVTVDDVNQADHEKR